MKKFLVIFPLLACACGCVGPGQTPSAGGGGFRFEAEKLPALMEFPPDPSTCPVLDDTRLCGWSSLVGGIKPALVTDPTDATQTVVGIHYKCATAPCADINEYLKLNLGKWPDPIVGSQDIFWEGDVYFGSPPAGNDPFCGGKINYLRNEWGPTNDFWSFLSTGPTASKPPMFLHVEHFNGTTTVGHDSSTKLDYNTWYWLAIAVHLNTPGQSDGTIRVWLNGSLVPDLNLKSLNLRGNFTTGFRTIDTGDQVQGSNFSNTEDCWRYLRNIKISKFIP